METKKNNLFDPELLRNAVINWDEHVGKEFMVKKLSDENGTLYFAHTEDHKMIILEFNERKPLPAPNQEDKTKKFLRELDEFEELSRKSTLVIG